MEAAAGSEKEENKRVAVLESSSIDADDHHQEAACKDDEIVLKVGNGRSSQENNKVKSSSPEHKELSCSKRISATTTIKGCSEEPDHSMASISSSRKDQLDIYKLESARAEMGEVRQENQRLKNYLGRITEDYQTLQMQFYDIKKKSNKSKDVPIVAASPYNNNSDQGDESDLVSLSLGSFPSKNKREEKNKNPSTSTSQGNKENHESDRESLSLGLDCKYEAHNKSSGVTTLSDQVPATNPSPASSLEEVRKEDAGETWPPRKVLKTMRTVEDEVGQQSPVKKARVSVRARCDTPTMNDGCQWRKYGQKIAKGNPCPRAYYRCTIAPSCPVRKQVQRCADDMSILITTYEGAHNHPLPMSATAMASTTSAAASMLLSGSSSTSARSGLNPSLGSTTTTPSHHDLHGYNFYLSDTSKSRFYMPNSSLSSSLPTITLDLTSSNPSSSSNSLSHFNKFSSSSSSNSSHHPTSLNFGSHSESNTNMSWNNNGFLSYGSTQLPPSNVNTNKNQIGSIGSSLGSLGIRQPMQQNNYQSFMYKNINPTLPSSQGFAHHQLQPSDPIAAATKAITSDPSFQSALAAALTSIIGSTSSTVGTPGILGNNSNQSSSSVLGMEKFKSDFILASYFNKQSANNSANSQPAGSSSLMFLPPSLPFSSAPKSASTSPGDTRDRKSL